MLASFPSLLNNTAFPTMAVAAIMASGIFSLCRRRNVIAWSAYWLADRHAVSDSKKGTDALFFIGL